MGVIRLARAHDTASRSDLLVERSWPRGMTRAALESSTWLPDVGPSHELRTWFGHDPQKWDEVRQRCSAEIDEHPQAWLPLRDYLSSRLEGIGPR